MRPWRRPRGADHAAIDAIVTGWQTATTQVNTAACSTADHAPRCPPDSSVISHSFTVVLQLRMVIDLYRGDAMTLFNRLFVRSALRRCE
jgi:hypothetical protein